MAGPENSTDNGRTVQNEMRSLFPGMYTRTQGQGSLSAQSTPRAAVTRAIQGVHYELQQEYVQSVLSPHSSVTSQRSPRSSQLESPSSSRVQPSSSNVSPYPYRPFTAPTYNPRRGYGPIRNRPRNNPYLSRPSTSTPRTENQGRKFTKNVVMVASDDEIVPRGRRREELHKLGVIVNLVDFYSNWDEDRMEVAIEEALGGVIDQEKKCPRFQYLKAMSGKLVVPNVGPNHTWTGEKVRALAGQGDIYIKTTYPLLLNPTAVEDEQSPSTSALDPPHDKESPSTSPLDPVHLPRDGTGSLQEATHEAKIAHLQDVLGCTYSRSSLVESLEEHDGDVEKALDALLRSESSHPSRSRAGLAGSASSSADRSGPSTSASSGCCIDLTRSDDTTEDFQTLLEKLSNQVISHRYQDLLVKRQQVWRHALAFYKGSKQSPDRLRLRLCVEFEGEEGVDAGALTSDFFECMYNEINDKLFEGHPTCRFPKKNWSLEKNFELAGMCIAHGLVQNGSGFPVLSPAIFEFLVHQDNEKVLPHLPSLSMLPEDYTSHDVIELIKKLDSASTKEEIDEIVDDKITIINQSGWDAATMITTANKAEVIQGLIMDEVIRKRETNIRALRRGLDTLGVLSLIVTHPDHFSQLFTSSGSKLSADAMKKLIVTPASMTDEQRLAAQHFFDYLLSRENEPPGTTIEGKVRPNLENILKFVSGMSSVPQLGHKEISVFFLPPDKTLPEVNACFWYLHLPVCHSAKQDFFKAMDQAVLMSVSYFGQS